MTEPWGALRVEAVDDEIIVTLPGTTYNVTYYKPDKAPELLARTSLGKGTIVVSR